MGKLHDKLHQDNGIKAQRQNTQHSTDVNGGILSIEWESLHTGFTLHTQDSPIQIHGAESGVLSVEY